MTLDKQSVEQGRTALDQYRQAHDALYAQGLDQKTLDDEHARLFADLNTAVSQLGLASVEQIIQDEKHYAEIKALDDYNLNLLDLVLKGSAPIRYADITGYAYPDQRKILKNVAVMRANDEVEDVVILGGVIGLAKPIVTAPATDAAAARAAGLGLNVVYQPQVRTTVFMLQHDLAVTIITRDRFASKAEANQAIHAYGCQLLEAFGVTQPSKDRVTSNNVMVAGKKLGSAMVNNNQPGVFWAHFNITLDFDFAAAAVIYQDAAIADKITTVKAETGTLPTLQDIRDACLTVGAKIFDGKLVAGDLSEKELAV